MMNVNTALETIATLTNDEIAGLNDNELKAAIEAANYIIHAAKHNLAKRTAEREFGEAYKKRVEREQVKSDIDSDLAKLRSLPQYNALVSDASLIMHALRRGNKDAAARLKEQLYTDLAPHGIDNARVVAHLMNL